MKGALDFVTSDESGTFKKISLKNSRKYWAWLLIAYVLPETFEKLSSEVEESKKAQILLVEVMAMTEETEEKTYPASFVRDFMRFYSIFIEHNDARMFTHKSFDQAIDDAMEEYHQTYVKPEENK